MHIDAIVEHSTLRDAEAIALREAVVQTERKLLEVLNFDFTVVHAYFFIEELSARFVGDPTYFLQTCWALINDMYRSTTLCLHYHPKVLAAAAMYIGSLKSAHPLRCIDSNMQWEPALETDRVTLDRTRMLFFFDSHATKASMLSSTIVNRLSNGLISTR
jgi:hypothetical protein